MDIERQVMGLRELSDDELLSSLRGVLGSSRRLRALLLAHLAEVEQRRLHLLAGHESMFRYCTRRLGMSEDEACRRIDVARLARRFPSLLEPLADGRLSLSVAALLKHHLTQSNHVALVAAVRGKTVFRAREVLASWFPRPDVPASIRKLPARRARSVGDSERSGLAASTLLAISGARGDAACEGAAASHDEIAVSQCSTAPSPPDAWHPHAAGTPVADATLALDAKPSRSTSPVYLDPDRASLPRSTVAHGTAEHTVPPRSGRQDLAPGCNLPDRIAAQRTDAEPVAGELGAVERADAERVASERSAVERADAERIASERSAVQRADAGQVASERMTGECLPSERADARRVACERSAGGRVNDKFAACERVGPERMAECLAPEHAGPERGASDHIGSERRARKLLASERVAGECVASDHIGPERMAECLAPEHAGLERGAPDHVGPERMAECLAPEHAGPERGAPDRVGPERMAECLAPEHAGPERGASDHIGSERMARKRLASERVAGERVAPEGLAPGRGATHPRPAELIAPESIAVELALVESQQRAASKSARAQRTRAVIEPLSSERYRVQFTADAELKRKLELARDLLRHTVPDGDLPTIIGRALELLLEKTLKSRFGHTKPREARTASQQTAQRMPAVPATPADPETVMHSDPSSMSWDPSGPSGPDSDPTRVSHNSGLGRSQAAPCESGTSADVPAAYEPPPATGAPGRSRYIPSAVRRTVLERDGLRCTWIGPDGARCESRAWLEYDHIVPRGMGGADDPANVRIRCRSHNQLAAEHAYGQATIARIVSRHRAARQTSNVEAQPHPTSCAARQTLNARAQPDPTSSRRA